ncbi:MAG TPA: type VII secretion target [Pseudonocardia sp.]|nr:type VII secretion target [Pseudonocardia sp.]
MTSQEDGFCVHTGNMSAHADRLREASARFAAAGSAARTVTVGSEAFGLVGTALAGDVLRTAELIARGLTGQAAALRTLAEGVEATTRAYEATERRACAGFGW